jgi:uncharacterized membrane protein
MTFCLLTALAWGIWTVCLKQSTRYISPVMSQMLAVCVNLVLVPVYIYVTRQQPSSLDFRRGFMWAALSVVFAATGGLLNLTALSRMDAGVVAAVAATYPALTMLIMVLLGQEALTLMKGLGVFLVILGVIVLSV